jgi:hypothetical protein
MWCSAMKYQPPLQNCIAFWRQHHSFLSNTNVSNITHYSHASSSSVVTCHRRYMSFTVFWWQTWQAWVGQFQIERCRLYCSFQTEQPYSSDGLIRDLLVCSFTEIEQMIRFLHMKRDMFYWRYLHSSHISIFFLIVNYSNGWPWKV